MGKVSFGIVNQVDLILSKLHWPSKFQQKNLFLKASLSVLN